MQFLFSTSFYDLLELDIVVFEPLSLITVNWMNKAERLFAGHERFTRRHPTEKDGIPHMAW